MAYQTALKASEIRLLVESKLGELLSRTIKRGNPNLNSSTDGRIRLRDLGLTEQDSHRYQKVANYKHLIPDIIEIAKNIKKN